VYEIFGLEDGVSMRDNVATNLTTLESIPGWDLEEIPWMKRKAVFLLSMPHFRTLWREKVDADAHDFEVTETHFHTTPASDDLTGDLLTLLVSVDVFDNTTRSLEPGSLHVTISRQEILRLMQFIPRNTDVQPWSEWSTAAIIRCIGQGLTLFTTHGGRTVTLTTETKPIHDGGQSSRLFISTYSPFAHALAEEQPLCPPSIRADHIAPKGWNKVDLTETYWHGLRYRRDVSSIFGPETYDWAKYGLGTTYVVAADITLHDTRVERLIFDGKRIITGMVSD
jgi:hypothetical protein